MALIENIIIKTRSQRYRYCNVDGKKNDFPIKNNVLLVAGTLLKTNELRKIVVSSPFLKDLKDEKLIF